MLRISVITVLMIFIAVVPQARVTDLRALENISQQVIGSEDNRICYAEKMSGKDVGEKVNACDTALGSQRGEIRLSGGGNIATQIVVSSNHTLHVISGDYWATTNGVVIRLKDNSNLMCDSWTPTLRESTGRAGVTSPFTIVAPYNGASAD